MSDQPIKFPMWLAEAENAFGAVARLMELIQRHGTEVVPPSTLDQTIQTCRQLQSQAKVIRGVSTMPPTPVSES